MRQINKKRQGAIPPYSGYIKLFRKFINWEHYNDPAAFRLFIHCLLSANIEPKQWNGITIQRGQFVSSIDLLAEITGLSRKQIRTTLEKLKKSGEISVETTNHFSLISINEYVRYQAGFGHKGTQKGTQKGTPKPADADNFPDIGAHKRARNRALTKEYKEEEYKYSSSSSIKEEEEEILKNIAKRHKIKYFQPWLRKIVANGDYIELLENEKKRLERKKEAEAEQDAEKKLDEGIDAAADEEKIIQIQSRIRKNLRGIK